MQSAVTIAVIIAVIVLIWIYYQEYTGKRAAAANAERRANAQEIIDNFERDDVRANVMREFDEHDENDELEGLNSDELFTIASALLHEIDLAQDGVILVDDAQDLRAKAKRAMSAAISARNRENANQQHDQVEHRHQAVARIPPIFHDDAIERRALDVGLVGAFIDPIPVARAPFAIRGHFAPAVPPRMTPERGARWAPDPENVHDSAVGDDVTRRIALLRDKDLHMFDHREVIGHVIGMMQDAKVDPEKRARIIRTLDTARANADCARYGITELEALRLVAERVHHARDADESQNIRDAVLNSLAECATDGGTVCLVGRISRYAGALDAVDTGMPETIHSVDAYRSEIMTGLGKLQTDSPNGIGEQQVSAFLEQYKDKLPAHSFDNIKRECIAAVS